MKILKHFYTLKNIIFTEQLRTTASVFKEHNFNIENLILIGVRKKNPGKKTLCKGLGLVVLQNLFTSVVKES